MPIRLRHLRRTVSYTLLAKGAVSGAFVLLTLCGVTLPIFGVDYPAHAQYGAAGIGGLIGAALALKA